MSLAAIFVYNFLWWKFRIDIYSEPIRFIPKFVLEPIRIHLAQSEKSFQSGLMQIDKKSIRLYPS